MSALITTTVADADLWGHLRFGLDMLESWSLPLYDHYSFTSDRRWINHEWLAELLAGVSYSALGATGLVLLKLGVIAVIALTVYTIAREEQASPLATDLFVALTIFATYSRTQVVRPQMFSVALFCVVLFLLRRADRGTTKALLAVPVCFALWVNLHGGWLVGLGALAVWLAGDALRKRDLRRALTRASVGMMSVFATLLNPYGWRLWQFMAETVRFERADITDWKSLFQLPASVLVVEAVLPVVAVAAVWRTWGRQSIAWRDAAVLAVLTAATVKLGRVDAFLQSAIAVLLAPQIVGLLNRVEARLPATFRRSSPVAGITAVLVAVCIAVVAVPNLRIVRIGGDWIPDREAALFLRDTRQGARVLTWFDWGEYALWHLSPSDILISMDGRRETVYSAGVLSDHLRFYRADPNMVDYPYRIGADHVWLPSHFRMIEALEEQGWIRVFTTNRSVVLAKTGEPAEYQAPVQVGPDAFPWP